MQLIFLRAFPLRHLLLLRLESLMIGAAVFLIFLGDNAPWNTTFTLEFLVLPTPVLVNY